MKSGIQIFLTILFGLNLQSKICTEQLSGVLAQAPDIQWSKTYGGDYIDFANSIYQTADEGFVIAGSARSSQSGDVSGVTNYSGHVWVIKTDDSGIIEWERIYGGSASDVATCIQQTTEGGYIVAGYTSSSDGDVGGNNGQVDFWVIKLNPDGDLQWEQNYGSSGQDYAYSVLQTTDGGYIVAGHAGSSDGDVTGYHGGGDMWVIKLQADGSLEWQRALGGGGWDEGRSIQQTTDGGYIVAGAAQSIDGDVGGNNGATDVWVVKLSSTGTIQWEQNYGGSNNEHAHSIQQTTDGGYIIAGYTFSDDGDVGGNNGFWDVWVIKISSTGALQWEKNYGGSGDDRASSIKQTPDGGYILAGWTRSLEVPGHIGNRDFWVIKMDNTGNMEWQKPMGGTDHDFAQSIQLTTDGGYIIAGHTDSNDIDVSGNNGLTNFWVVKLGSVVGVKDPNPPAVRLYPNPVQDILYLTGDETINAVVVYSIYGQSLMSQMASDRKEQINIGHLNAGIYLIEANIGGQNRTFKIVKN